jgi:hypothetical protein
MSCCGQRLQCCDGRCQLVNRCFIAAPEAPDGDQSNWSGAAAGGLWCVAIHQADTDGRTEIMTEPPFCLQFSQWSVTVFKLVFFAVLTATCGCPDLARGSETGGDLQARRHPGTGPLPPERVATRRCPIRSGKTPSILSSRGSRPAREEERERQGGVPGPAGRLTGGRRRPTSRNRSGGTGLRRQEGPGERAPAPLQGAQSSQRTSNYQRLGPRCC